MPSTPTTLTDYLTHFRRRVIEDALLEATAGYWRNRADTFDTVGTTTADATALACRRHADLLIDLGLDDQATALLNEVYTEIGATP